MRIFAGFRRSEAYPPDRASGRIRQWRVWRDALAVVVIAAAPAGLLAWHPWSPDAVGRQKPMEFTTAPGGSARFGTGEELYRYKMWVENGFEEGPERFAAEVDAILGDVRQGSVADATPSFLPVPAGPMDLTVYPATR